MEKRKSYIDAVPALLYGEESDRLYLYVHGFMGCKEEAEGFAETACGRGWQVMAIDLPEHGERRNGAEKLDPWTVMPELESVMQYCRSGWREVAIFASSLGAWMSLMTYGGGNEPDKALFVSPLLDMEGVILGRMARAGITEARLREAGEIPCGEGQDLSWSYLSWVREHGLNGWSCPTCILYPSLDYMTPRKTAEGFAAQYNAELTVFEGGEHWFHTPEQLAALRAWERDNI